MSFDPERFREVNRMYAKEGLPVMMPEDWPLIHQMVQDITRNDSLRVGPLDDDDDAKVLAQETIGNYWWSIGMEFPNEQRLGHESRRKDTEIAEHGGPQYDPSEATTFNRLYGILAGLPEQLIPLSAEYTWKDVVNQRLRHYYDCNVRVSTDCMGDFATERFAIKSGEFVCIYASCNACRAWFDLDNFDRRTTQARPLIGYDFRNGTFRR